MSKKTQIITASLLLFILAVYGTGIASQLIYAMLGWFDGNAGLGQGLAGLVSGAITESETEVTAVQTTAPLNIGHPIDNTEIHKA